MPQLHAYLSYDGNCAEAMRFYERVLGARLDAMITYQDAPGMPKEMQADANRVLHAHLVHKDFALMAGDTPPGVPFESIRGVQMTLTYPTRDEASRTFAALAQGGRVVMPLAETFWADTFGMVTDRFGTPWGVNGGMKPMPGRQT